MGKILTHLAGALPSTILPWLVRSDKHVQRNKRLGCKQIDSGNLATSSVYLVALVYDVAPVVIGSVILLVLYTTHLRNTNNNLHTRITGAFASVRIDKQKLSILFTAQIGHNHLSSLTNCKLNMNKKVS